MEKKEYQDDELQLIGDSKWQIVYISKNCLRSLLAATFPGKKDSYKVVAGKQTARFGRKITVKLAEKLNREQAIEFIQIWIKKNPTGIQ